MSELFQTFRHDKNKHDLQIVRNFAAIYRPEVLLCSQEHVTTSARWIQSTSLSYFFKINFNIILTSTSNSPKRSPPAIILYIFYIFPTHATIRSNLIHSKIVNLVIIFDQPITRPLPTHFTLSFCYFNLDPNIQRNTISELKCLITTAPY